MRRTMAPLETRRPFKRPAISDQQRRREIALARQAQGRRDAQHHARDIAASLTSLHSDIETPTSPSPPKQGSFSEQKDAVLLRDLDLTDVSILRGSNACRWFAEQFMFPEWMIDIPPSLDCDWYVFPRPSGKRCFVISCNGTTISRLRNGSILHYFPSALPDGAKIKNQPSSSQVFSLLDCIFHEADQTYYVIDIVCWRGYSLCNCTAEFRFYWLNTKISETSACNPPSLYHRYRFSTVFFYDCNQIGLQRAYAFSVPYVKDGLLFYNKHAHYQSGTTPLVLVWKDRNCSQYFLDTDAQGHVPNHQQVVLELGDDGKLMTSDDPPVIFGCLERNFIQESSLCPGHLLRFSIAPGGLKVVDGKLVMADLEYNGRTHHSRAFADSYSKVLFQYAARNCPLKFEDLFASVQSTAGADEAMEVV